MYAHSEVEAVVSIVRSRQAERVIVVGVDEGVVRITTVVGEVGSPNIERGSRCHAEEGGRASDESKRGDEHFRRI